MVAMDYVASEYQKWGNLTESHGQNDGTPMDVSLIGVRVRQRPVTRPAYDVQNIP